jgi:acetoin utilization deacetylase AcuC-like enzyme
VFIVYSPRYRIDIGPHVFPTLKYGLVHDVLIGQGVVHPADVLEPAPASWEELGLVHTAAYLRQARTGGFTSSELAHMELPWSPAIAEGFRLMAGGTIVAARTALDESARLKTAPREAQATVNGKPKLAVTAQLGGGFHHAFADHGEGFCLFNDIAVAIRVLQVERGCARIAVIDCDVHQGNGTAQIFHQDPSVFTFSIHHEHNYPAHKPPGSLDVGLPDAASDDEYLRALELALPRVFERTPELVIYVAGADPYRDDQLGGLNLTVQGLRLRDFLVMKTARTAGVPVAIVLAGGYARRIEDTVAIHAATIEEAARMAG